MRQAFFALHKDKVLLRMFNTFEGNQEKCNVLWQMKII